jgi:hypothetical protein
LAAVSLYVDSGFIRLRPFGKPDDGFYGVQLTKINHFFPKRGKKSTTIKPSFLMDNTDSLFKIPAFVRDVCAVRG